MFLEGLLALTFAAAGGLLLLAGAVKLRRPATTTRALRSIGLPGGDLAVRALGAAEVAVGLIALLAPQLAALPLALLYVSFGAFVGEILRRGLPLSSCGCLGETDTRPSHAHVAVTLIAALAGVAAALVPPPAVTEVLAEDPGVGAPLALSVVTATYLAYLVLAFLPDALSAYRRQGHADSESTI